VVAADILRNTFALEVAGIGGKTRVVFNGVDPQMFCPREEVRGEQGRSSLSGASIANRVCWS